jgi:hypothetical protein
MFFKGVNTIKGYEIFNFAKIIALCGPNVENHRIYLK